MGKRHVIGDAMKQNMRFVQVNKILLWAVLSAQFLLCSLAAGQSTGSLCVVIEPEEAQILGAAWRRLGMDIWHASGEIETGIAVDTHIVEFSEVPEWYKPLNRQVSILSGQTCLLSITYSPYPVPGPDFAGCAPMGGVGSQPYAPLPLFNIMTPEGDVWNWPTGSYDFCAYMDTIYCSLEAVVYLNASLEDFASLIQCMNADLNGPLTMEAVPFTGNLIPDGSCELGILAAVLNNSGHPLHEDVTSAFEYNVFEAKELLIQALSDVPGYGDLREIVNFVAPYLVRSLACVLAGYATLGDSDTFSMLNALLDRLNELGVTPPEGGIEAISQSVPAIGPEGDANGDGFTNRQAYGWFVEHLGYSCYDFTIAAIDFDSPIRLLSLEGGGVYEAGDTIELKAILENDVVSLSGGAQSFSWQKDGETIAQQVEESLYLENMTEEDSGLYTVSVAVEVLLKDGDDSSLVLEAQAEVEVLPPVNTGGGLFFLVLSQMILLGGIVLMKKKTINASWAK